MNENHQHDIDEKARRAPKIGTVSSRTGKVTVREPVTDDTTAPEPTVDTMPIFHLESADEHVVCHLDGREWRMFPYAHNPVVGSVENRDLLPLTRLPDDGGIHVRYEWTCGNHQLIGTLPATDYQPCTYGHPAGCDKAMRWTNAPSDLHTNPRHGGQCVCCGHQGGHYVRRDGLNLPLCKRPSV